MSSDAIGSHSHSSHHNSAAESAGSHQLCRDVLSPEDFSDSETLICEHKMTDIDVKNHT